VPNFRPQRARQGCTNSTKPTSDGQGCPSYTCPSAGHPGPRFHDHPAYDGQAVYTQVKLGSDLLEQVHDFTSQVRSVPMASLVASPSARMALR
jgi:hypothetical protein